jgi:DNA adenine methylase
MNGTIPHIVQYQGSKRILAPQILKYMPLRFNRLVEPFAGMAAMTIAAAKQNRAGCYLVNDINTPIVKILQSTIDTPQTMVEEYTKIWSEQFDYPGGSVEHFYKIRKEFNEGNQSAAMMLYLLARCVKGSVRYGSNGQFNQSPDKRRHGTTPKSLKRNVDEISWYLKDKTMFMSTDYREVLSRSKKGDVVYMDPPYQGVSNVRDSRYLSGISFDDFIDAVDQLNVRGVDFLISYDGRCGDKTYGEDLPSELGLMKIMLNAGLSSQSILLGKKETTFEALYISRGLQESISFTTSQKQAVQLELFAV